MITDKSTHGSTLQKPLRLWPGIVIVLLQWLFRFGIPVFYPDALKTGIIAGLIGGIAIVLWWAFLSRAPWLERLTAIVLMILAEIATFHIIDISIKTAMMGLMFTLYSIPVLCLAFVAWAVATRRLSNSTRRITMVATIIFASGVWALLRTDGMDGEGHQDIVWRWAKSSEERLLAQTNNKIETAPSQLAIKETDAEWPGFRGLHRDNIINGIQIKTDWAKTPPVVMWRRSIGPACSSFAIHGNLLYTQEQRGVYEMVVCYNLNTGMPVWVHRDSARFWDSHAGPGPRSTPTLYKGRVYTLGATGILNVMDESNGSLVWSRNAAHDTDVKIPGWGYTSSPLVTDSIVVVAISGKLVAYDSKDGKQRWAGPNGGESYSSPYLLTINSIKQILLMSYTGAACFALSDGKELWKLPFNGFQIVQPALIDEGELLVSAGDINGMKRITIKNGSGGWTVKEQWTSTMLRPNFNDFVIHKGHVYGYDGPSLACMDIDKGNRQWKGGRYGGQIILLADQDLLLVLSEKGELALVMATPEQYKELAHFPAIKGKTWNHPVLVGYVLVVRNSEEMAAFRLPLKGE